MKRIVETLLEEGILEEDIHRILDMIEEEYEVVNEVSDELVSRLYKKRKDIENKADEKQHFMDTVGRTQLMYAKKSGDKERAKKIKQAINKADDEVINAVKKRLLTQQSIDKRQKRLGRPSIFR